MAGNILQKILLTAVQTFLSAGWTEGWYCGTFSKRGLENAK